MGSIHVRYEELFEVQDDIEKGRGGWLQELSQVHSDLSNIIASEDFAGAASQAMDTYIQEVHYMILRSLYNVLQEIHVQLQLYVEGYLSNIDESYDTEISLDVILDQIDVMEQRKVLFTDISLDIADTISSVSDLVSISSPDGGEVEDGYDTGKAFLEKLGEDIQTYEEERVAQDFILLKSMTGNLKDLIRAFSGKGSIHIGSYHSGDAIQSEAMQKAVILSELHKAYTDERKAEYENAIESYIIRMESQNRIVEGKLQLGGAIAMALGSSAVIKAGMVMPHPVLAGACYVVGAAGAIISVAEGVEGVQEILYGLSWDNESVAFNPIRDTIFGGNQKIYDAVGVTVLASMNLILLGTMTYQSGVQAVVKELVKDTVSAGIGNEVSKIAAEQGADAFEQMLIGITGAMFARGGIEGLEYAITSLDNKGFVDLDAFSGKGDNKGGGNSTPGTSKLIGAGEGEKFGTYASKATPIDGYTDVIVHGAPPNQVGVMHNGEWAYLDQRSLANYLRQDAGYTGGNIRLLSCGTGSTPNGFAQNLSNKMGVEVLAPSDTIWAFPNGKLTIGPNSFSNTGQWNIFSPGSH